MAAKKEEVIDNVEEVKKAEPKKAAPKKDPWNETKTIRIPKESDGSPNYVIASVNGRVFKIQKGVEVNVPTPIAEVIEHSFEAKDEAELFVESKTE